MPNTLKHLQGITAAAGTNLTATKPLNVLLNTRILDQPVRTNET